jgi:photosystem I subunit 9
VVDRSAITNCLEFSGAEFMQYFVKFLSTAPVLAILWISIQAAALIEFNRFFPDLLFHPMP